LLREWTRKPKGNWSGLRKFGKKKKGDTSGREAVFYREKGGDSRKKEDFFREETLRQWMTLIVWGREPLGAGEAGPGKPRGAWVRNMVS